MINQLLDLKIKYHIILQLKGKAGFELLCEYGTFL